MTQAACVQPPDQGETSRKIRDSLAEMISDNEAPGMIAAISSSKGIVAIGSAGVRKAGSDAALTDDDLVHIGSCTKAMTCALLAILVADGTLDWNTTLIEALPEVEPVIHSDYHQVTLWQLVTHRAGIRANAQDWWVHQDLELKDRRLAILKENLDEAPAVEVGEYHYSNLGYMVAGCMAEKLTGSTWESLLNKHLFEPLGMTSAGFGPPGENNGIDQPWGHIRANGQWQPKRFDNAEALGPAGRVHCTLEDWAKFLALQMLRGEKPVLDREKLDRLIEPVGNYAGGWGVTQRPWARGLALTHSGSNTMWYATVWVAPEIDRAFIVATNFCDDNSHALCDRMIGKLITIDR